MIQHVPLNRSLVPAVVDLWNRELGERFPMRASLFIQNSIEDVHVLKDGSVVLMDAVTDEAIGLVVSKKLSTEDPYWDMLAHDQDTGWIQVLLVDRRYRGQGFGSRLLEIAENALMVSGAKKIVLGGDPWHYFPGVPADDGTALKWFQKRRYRAGQTVYDLLCRKENLPDLPAVDASGVTGRQKSHLTYRLLRASEKERFLKFIQKVFPGRWTYEAYHYFLKGGQGREILVAEKDGEMIGFCRLHDDRSPLIAQNVYWAPLFPGLHLGGVGPLGLDPAERGGGYGLAMVRAALEELFRRGQEYVVIDWTELVGFYERLGCRVWKSYVYHEKV